MINVLSTLDDGFKPELGAYETNLLSRSLGGDHRPQQRSPSTAGGADVVIRNSSTDIPVAIPLGNINGVAGADFIGAVKETATGTEARVTFGGPIAGLSTRPYDMTLTIPGSLTGSPLFASSSTIQWRLQWRRPRRHWVVIAKRDVDTKIYLLLGRDNWPATIDAVAQADVTLHDPTWLAHSSETSQ